MGEEIGEVTDMVIDVDNAKITYVIVGTGGFMNIGEKDVVVPWNALKLQSGDGSLTGGQQNAFTLQADKARFSDFPDMGWKSTFPKLGQPADDWDADIRNYWESGTVPDGAGGTTGTVVPDTTGTSVPDGTTVPEATATGTTGQGQGEGLGLGQRLPGVMLASDVLGSTVNLGAMPGTGEPGSPAQPKGTATSSGSTTSQATSTPGDSTLPQATATVGVGQNEASNLTVTINDMIVDTNNGKIQYVVVTSSFDDGEHWIPVPLGLLQWDGTNQTFSLNTDADMMTNAPFFTEDQFPDTASNGWDDEFSSYWKAGEAGNGIGTDSSGQATATPTP